MKNPEEIIDFSDRTQKLRFLSRIGTFAGKWRFSFRKYKPKRSLKANGFYWAAVVPAMQEFMREHGQIFDADQVHEFFLQTHSSVPVVDPFTGEVLKEIGQRSSEMDSGEFAEYVNDCIAWMYERFLITVPDPAEYYNTKQEATASGK